MRRATIIAAKALIVVLGAVLLAGQVWFIPLLSIEMADEAPEFEMLRVPGTVLPILLLVCVEVVLVCVWRLLSMVHADRIFRASAFGWVNAIIVAIVAATTLVAIGLLVLDRAQAGSPPVAIAGAFAIIVGSGLALVVAVMKGLLRKASDLEREMDAVV